MTNDKNFGEYKEAPIELPTLAVKIHSIATKKRGQPRG
jgi:hypothetical protein